MSDAPAHDTDQIKEWRSIVTLIVFVLTNLVVLFPFEIPVLIPRVLYNAFWNSLAKLRITAPRQHQSLAQDGQGSSQKWWSTHFVKRHFPMGIVTGPLIADLFLLAISAIHAQEVHDGTVGANNISPIDIMAFFISLAYIAISIDASGLIRYLAFKVLVWGGRVGHRLFLYLYAFFFGLGTFIGNDPIILSGTAFLAYMTRVSSNIEHPRAWIHAQFAVANIASAILVSSNPTNLVLAGAFQIKFIDYTANMIVPVIATVIVLFPFLLYIVFAEESLIPIAIKMHELPPEYERRDPVNPNIPNARGVAEQEEDSVDDNEQANLLRLEEIMNPFLDKSGAAFGLLIMATTLITLLVLNAVSASGNEHPVYWVTVPAAFVMLCWDLASGWLHRHETREVSRLGREEVERARAERELSGEREEKAGSVAEPQDRDELGIVGSAREHPTVVTGSTELSEGSNSSRDGDDTITITCVDDPQRPPLTPTLLVPKDDQGSADTADDPVQSQVIVQGDTDEKHPVSKVEKESPPATSGDEEKALRHEKPPTKNPQPTTLVSICQQRYRWLQETFPTVMAVMGHLPFALVPFALSMFVLVQALVTKGWVPVFAYGWDHWVSKTGTVGSVGGMAFLSVILCNFAGTNIGTTILLCRVIQYWVTIHERSGVPIPNRTFWATVYSMAIGVNYGAFSAAFSASLAGMLWRDILDRKHIHVRRAEFARVNLPIIAIAMTVGCVVLIGEVYIVRGEEPYTGTG